MITHGQYSIENEIQHLLVKHLALSQSPARDSVINVFYEFFKYVMCIQKLIHDVFNNILKRVNI